MAFSHRIATKAGALVEVCIKAESKLAGESQETIMKTLRQRINIHKALKAMKTGDVFTCLDNQVVIRAQAGKEKAIKNPLKRFWQWLTFNIQRLFNGLKFLEKKRFDINQLQDSGFKFLVNSEINTLPPEIQKQLWDEMTKANKIQINRPGVLRQAETITGVKIYDYGNFTPREMALFVVHLVNDFIKATGGKKGTPWLISNPRNGGAVTNQGIKHIIVGHGVGTPGQNWTFIGGQDSVEAFLHKNIPKGESALVVVCQNGLPRNVALREGHIIQSNGHP